MIFNVTFCIIQFTPSAYCNHNGKIQSPEHKILFWRHKWIHSPHPWPPFPPPNPPFTLLNNDKTTIICGSSIFGRAPCLMLLQFEPSMPHRRMCVCVWQIRECKCRSFAVKPHLIPSHPAFGRSSLLSTLLSLRDPQTQRCRPHLF